MSVCIKESGLLFGDYNDGDVFHIEKSQIYGALGSGIKTVEFVLRFNTEKIYFIEAKSSAPKPNKEDIKKDNFDTFINEIAEKIEHSLDIFFAVLVKRIEDTGKEFPSSFQKIDYSSIEVAALLVINNHKKEWLSPIKDALTRKLKRIMKTWKIQVAVLNQEMATKYHLIKGSSP
jgi:hypothetical protein